MTILETLTSTHSGQNPEGLGNLETSSRLRPDFDWQPGWREYDMLEVSARRIAEEVIKDPSFSEVLSDWLLDSIEHGVRNALQKIPDDSLSVAPSVFETLFKSSINSKEMEECLLECLMCALQYQDASCLLFAMERMFRDGVAERQALVLQGSMKEE
jgi:hypothetical protein